jgi:hypothetical protein
MSAKVVSSKISSEVTEIVAKKTLNTTAKAVGKSLAKKIPFVGLGAGAVFAVNRFSNGDIIGGLGEITSGLLSIIPVIGTAASIAVDGALLVRDMNNVQGHVRTMSDHIRETDEIISTTNDFIERNEKSKVRIEKIKDKMLTDGKIDIGDEKHVLEMLAEKQKLNKSKQDQLEKLSELKRLKDEREKRLDNTNLTDDVKKLLMKRINEDIKRKESTLDETRMLTHGRQDGSIKKILDKGEEFTKELEKAYRSIPKTKKIEKRGRRLGRTNKYETITKEVPLSEEEINKERHLKTQEVIDRFAEKQFIKLFKKKFYEKEDLTEEEESDIKKLYGRALSSVDRKIKEAENKVKHYEDMTLESPDDNNAVTALEKYSTELSYEQTRLKIFQENMEKKVNKVLEKTDDIKEDTVDIKGMSDEQLDKKIAELRKLEDDDSKKTLAILEDEKKEREELAKKPLYKQLAERMLGENTPLGSMLRDAQASSGILAEKMSGQANAALSKALGGRSIGEATSEYAGQISGKMKGAFQSEEFKKMREKLRPENFKAMLDEKSKDPVIRAKMGNFMNSLVGDGTKYSTEIRTAEGDKASVVPVGDGTATMEEVNASTGGEATEADLPPAGKKMVDILKAHNEQTALAVLQGVQAGAEVSATRGTAYHGQGKSSMSSIPKTRDHVTV